MYFHLYLKICHFIHVPQFWVTLKAKYQNVGVSVKFCLMFYLPVCISAWVLSKYFLTEYNEHTVLCNKDNVNKASGGTFPLYNPALSKPWQFHFYLPENHSFCCNVDDNWDLNIKQSSRVGYLRVSWEPGSQEMHQIEYMVSVFKSSK